MAAVFKVLLPLVRILLRQGVSHSEFSELARKAFVRVAFTDFEIEGRKQTVSRVAVITGLSRKEVLRLKTDDDQSISKVTKPINRAVRVINGWLNDPEFCAEGGAPRELPLHGEQGSFAALIKRYSGDITAGAVFDELTRVGAARENQGKAVLCAEGYVPSVTSAEQIEVAGMSAADLLKTLDHNLHVDPREQRRFQRQLIFHDVPLPVAKKFRELSAEKSNALLRELNRWLSIEKAAHGGESRVGRVGLGVYYIEDNINKLSSI